MTVHCLAYGLYMLSILVHQVIDVFYFLAGNTFRYLKLDTISNFFDSATGTFSQILLCVVFWQLASKLPRNQTNTQKESDSQHLSVKQSNSSLNAEDEYDQFQARIWN